MSNKITFDGLSSDEVLSLSEEELNALVFCNEAVVVNIGSSQILGRFSLEEGRIVIELAQVDGGGEGVLPAIGALASRIAKKMGLPQVDWLVHAVDCAMPNLKLRRMLERRGFEVREIGGIGTVFHQVTDVGQVAS